MAFVPSRYPTQFLLKEEEDIQQFYLGSPRRFVAPASLVMIIRLLDDGRAFYLPGASASSHQPGHDNEHENNFPIEES